VEEVEFYLYGWENLRGVGIFFLKNPSKLKKNSKKWGFQKTPTPPLNIPLGWMKTFLVRKAILNNFLFRTIFPKEGEW